MDVPHHKSIEQLFRNDASQRDPGGLVTAKDILAAIMDGAIRSSSVAYGLVGGHTGE